MKINDVIKPHAGSPGPASVGHAADSSVEQATSARAKVADKVSVAHGSVVDEASRIARTNRTSRLKEIEAAVHQGAYRPDPAQIADRILEDAEVAARLRASMMGR